MITVAIPTYNRGAVLLETLDRLFALDPGPGEIVVVDQTPEHPPEVAARLDDLHRRGSIVLVRLDAPSIPHAMNVALERARYEIVLFLDDDIEPSLGLVGAHAAAYRASEIWAVVGQVLQPGQQPEHFDEAVLRRGPLRDLGFRFHHDTSCDVENVMAGNLSVSRNRALSIGGFDENFTAAAYRFETEFARRVVNAGGRIRFEPAATLRHLQVPTGGVRSFGDHRCSASPAHATGDYYFARLHVSSFWRYAAGRLVRSVVTRWHLRHPWAIPPKLIGELRGLALALALARRGARLRE